MREKTGYTTAVVDTPPAKAGRFWLNASYLGPCPRRSSDGSGILDGVGLDLAVEAIRRPGADGGAAVDVPMRSTTMPNRAAVSARDRADTLPA